MLFTFWTGSTIAEPSSVAAWRDRFPSFTMFNEDDAINLIDSAMHRDLFKKIRIPSCKSDIARLLLLRHYGGFYIDAHSGPSNGDRLAETIEYLSHFDLTLFSASWERGFNFMNGFLLARRNAPVLDLIIRNAFENLVQHAKRESETQDHVPYNIIQLTGSAVILRCIFDATPTGWSMKPEYKDKIGFVVMPTSNSHGFHVASHNNYRKPGSHWSERQKNERLFVE
jgi:mannosyltransferase OCH1-like enzyme